MTQQEHYEECLRNGCSPLLADMLASRKPPHGRGFDSIIRNHKEGSEFEGDERTEQEYRAYAEKRGVHTRFKRYHSQAARYPKDPEAWIGNDDDLRRVCKKNNWAYNGIFTIKQHETEPKKPVPIAKDLLDDAVERELIRNPGKATNIAKVREEVRDRITPEYKK